jgi:hypothetical protein
MQLAASMTLDGVLQNVKMLVEKFARGIPSPRF